ncbi:MAG: hypothetical protein O7G85_16905, partial [Planctomycetota bacterium]|nr:hypothetical protein [Planctomycetota bacterium]
MSVQSTCIRGSGLLFIGVLALVPIENGGNTYWQYDPATTGDWFDAPNWSAGFPASNNDPIIENGGTAHIGAGAAAGRNIFIGFNDDGTLVHDGGSLTATNTVIIAQTATFTGQYDVSGGALLTSPSIRIGQYGDGIVNMSGGLLQLSASMTVGSDGSGWFYQTGGDVNVIDGCCSGHVDVAWGVGSYGRYELTGPATLTTNVLYVGQNGVGEFHQDGGLVDAVETVKIGVGAGSDGTYTLTGGGQILCKRVYIGNDGSDGATGLFIHEDGDVVANNTVGMSGNDSNSTYRMQSGSLTTVNMSLGRKGVSLFDQTGGTTLVTDYLSMRSDTGTSSTILLSGGVL